MLDIRVAAVQMHCPVRNSKANLDKIASLCAEARRQGVDIILFPELCVSGYDTSVDGSAQIERIPGPATERLETIARENEITILAGMLEEDISGIVYNTHVVVTPQRLAGIFRKLHVPTVENGVWRHGDDLPVFHHPKLRFGVEICYDSHFPELSTALTIRGAEVLFFPHASPGPESYEDKRARWLRYQPARACDNGGYVVVCNQVGDNGGGTTFPGVSHIFDPQGKLIAEAESAREQMIVADLSAALLAQVRRDRLFYFHYWRRPELYGDLVSRR